MGWRLSSGDGTRRIVSWCRCVLTRTVLPSLPGEDRGPPARALCNWPPNRYQPASPFETSPEPRPKNTSAGAHPHCNLCLAARPHLFASGSILSSWRGPISFSTISCPSTLKGPQYLNDCAKRQVFERTGAHLLICQPWQMIAMLKMSSAGTPHTPGGLDSAWSRLAGWFRESSVRHVNETILFNSGCFKHQARYAATAQTH